MPVETVQQLTGSIKLSNNVTIQLHNKIELDYVIKQKKTLHKLLRSMRGLQVSLKVCCCRFHEKFVFAGFIKSFLSLLPLKCQTVLFFLHRNPVFICRILNSRTTNIPSLMATYCS